MFLNLCYIFILVRIIQVTSQNVAVSIETLFSDTKVEEIEVTTETTEPNPDISIELLEIISKSKPIHTPDVAPIIPKVDDPKGELQLDLKKEIERIFDDTAFSIDKMSKPSKIKPRSPNAKSEIPQSVEVKSKILTPITNDQVGHKKRYIRLRNKKIWRRPTITENYRKTTYYDTIPGVRKHEDNIIKKTVMIEVIPQSARAKTNPKNAKPPGLRALVRYKTFNYDVMPRPTQRPKQNNIFKRLVDTVPELKGLNLDATKLFIPKYLRVQADQNDDLTFSVMNDRREIEFQPKNVVIADAIEIDDLNIPNLRINHPRFRRNIGEPNHKMDTQQKVEDMPTDYIKNSSAIETNNSDISEIPSTTDLLELETKQNPISEINSETLKVIAETHLIVSKNSSEKNIFKILEGQTTERQSTTKTSTSSLPEPLSEQKPNMEKKSGKENQTSFWKESKFNAKIPNKNLENTFSTYRPTPLPTRPKYSISFAEKSKYRSLPKKLYSELQSSGDHFKDGVSRTWDGAKRIASGTVDVADSVFDLFLNGAQHIGSSIFG